MDNPVRYQDPEGDACIPCITALGGALIAGAVEFGTQLVAAGGNIGEVDFIDVGASALQGAAVGSGMGWLAVGTTVVAEAVKAGADYTGDEGLKHVVNGGKTKTQAAADGFVSVAGGKALRVAGRTAQNAVSNVADNALGKSRTAYQAAKGAQKQAAQTPDKASINRANQTGATAKKAETKAKAAQTVKNAVGNKGVKYPVAFAANAMHEKGNNKLQDKLKPK